MDFPTKEQGSLRRAVNGTVFWKESEIHRERGDRVRPRHARTDPSNARHTDGQRIAIQQHTKVKRGCALGETPVSCPGKVWAMDKRQKAPPAGLSWISRRS